MQTLILPQMFSTISNPKAPYFPDVYGTAAVWANIAKLHLEDLEDIGQHILALQNLLPDIETAIIQVGHYTNFFQELLN